MFKQTQHKNAMMKMLSQKRLITLIELSEKLNRDKNSLLATAKSLDAEGQLKLRKVKMRFSQGNVNNVWLIHLKSVKTAEIMAYEEKLLNTPFQSPLVEHHCYGSNNTNYEEVEVQEVITNKDVINNPILDYFNDEVIIQNQYNNEKIELNVEVNDIIPIYNNNNERIINARELYEFIKSKYQFSDWIKERIYKYQFIENEDFMVFQKKLKNSKGGRPKIEYYLTIDTAKEIAMLENNEYGRKIRKYFIQIEKEYKKQNELPQTNNLEILKVMLLEMENQNKKIESLENELNSIRKVINY